MAVLVLFCQLFGFLGQKQEIPLEQHDVEVHLILVDVIVTKNGEFVRDLTKDEFALFEDGKKIPINSFELITLQERSFGIEKDTLEKKQPPRPRKKLLVLFDSINSWRRELLVQGENIIEELFSLVKLGHEIMICQMHPEKGMEILQPFTTDEQLIKKSMTIASGNVWNLGTDIGSIPPLADMEMGDPALYEDMIKMDYLYKERQKFEKTMGGILAALNLVQDQAGRKSILLISAGIPDLSPSDVMPNFGNRPDPRDRFWGRNQFSSPNARSGIQMMDEDISIFDPFNILGKKTFRNGEEVIRELIRFANAQNISLYSVNSDIFVRNVFSGTSAEYYQERDKPVFEFVNKARSNRAQNLRWLSEDTGADSLRGANKFESFRKVMGSDLNQYYQLSFYPRRKNADDLYHKIKVEVDRKGVNVRHRKGFTDYSREASANMRLVTAFYNPTQFKELPFDTEFNLFINESGKHEPWMNIALPPQEIFIKRFVGGGSRTFNLYVWINEEKTGEKGFGGRIDLPFKIDSNFMDFIKNIKHLDLHFKGPEIYFKPKDYRVVFALVDPETNEIGTWNSSFSLTDLKKDKVPIFVNCILGEMTLSSRPGNKTMSLSQKDGCLEFEGGKFFPSAIRSFKQWGGLSVFIQAYFPQGKKSIRPEFSISNEENLVQSIKGEIKTESWNAKTKIWNGLFFLDISRGTLGKNTLYVELPESQSDSVLTKELNLTIFR